jgi:hypothetical protein
MTRAASPSQVVAIVGHWGQQGALSHALDAIDPQTLVIAVDENSDLDDVRTHLQDYDDVWIALHPTDRASVDTGQRLAQRLQKSGHYTEVWRDRRSLHFRKVVRHSSAF